MVQVRPENDIIIEVDMVYAVRPTDGDDDEYFPEPMRSRTRSKGCVLLILILILFHLGIIPNSRVLYPIVGYYTQLIELAPMLTPL